jgi:hypothetical protein
MKIKIIFLKLIFWSRISNFLSPDHFSSFFFIIIIFIITLINSNGDLFLCFAEPLGFASSYQAKLCAVMTAIEVAQSRN